MNPFALNFNRGAIKWDEVVQNWAMYEMAQRMSLWLLIDVFGA